MIPARMLLLAQAVVTPGGAAGEGGEGGEAWWHVFVDNAFALTILFIFLAAIISVVLKQRRKDKCLKLLHQFHAALLTVQGKAIWGDLTVYSQGIELAYDAAYTTRRGIVKSSSMVYQKEMADTLALCRVDHALTDHERRERKRQVRRSFQPGLWRRSVRWVRNLIATLKDAFSQALNAVIGQFVKTRPGSTVAGQQAQVTDIGQTILGVTANAYEPILEAHIGRPVVLRVQSGVAPTNVSMELPGYLVDYTDAYIAVFNVEHEPEERFTLDVTQSQERANLKLELHDADVTITNPGPDAIVVDAIEQSEASCDTPGPRCELAVPLLAGCSITLRRTPGASVRLHLQRTRRLDVVAPRSVGSVHFAAETDGDARGRERGWLGIAPEQEAEEHEGLLERARRGLGLGLFKG